MIRILHLTTDSKISGAEKLLIGISKNFNRKDFELYFCTLKKRGDLHLELDKLNQKVFSLDCSSIFDIPNGIVKLRRLLKKYKIDILHTHLYHASLLGQILLRLQTKISLIITKHYSDLIYHYGNLFEVMSDRHSLRSANHIIAISNDVKNCMVRLDGVSPEKISVIYNGIITDEFLDKPADTALMRREFGIPDASKVIGAIGNLHPCKGYRYLIEAAAILSKNKDLNFVIIGDGVDRKKLTALRDALSLQDAVKFVGYRDDIAKSLAVFHILVQPSLIEGLGLSIIEAIACGKPVIGTNVGGIPEIIENNRTGILIPPKNASALAEAIINILDNYETFKESNKTAQEDFRAKFDIKNMVRQYEEVYKNTFSKYRKPHNGQVKTALR